MKSVVIVGAGVVGLFCAVRLAQAGARVTLLEAEAEEVGVFGPRASSAAAGMLAPLGEAPAAHERVALASFDLWKRLQDGAVWGDGVRFDGGVVVAANPEEASAFVANAARLERKAQSLSSSAFRSRTNLAARVEHALFVEDEGVADPQRVLSGLVMDARRHGVTVKFGKDVREARANTVITHDDEIFEADHVVLAPGAWATSALQSAAPALRRVEAAKGHIVSVVLEKALKPNLRGKGFYLAQRLEDVVLGSTMEPGVYDRGIDPARVNALLAAAEALAPGEVKPRGQVWTGIRPMSPDGAPMIGASGDVLVAAGHSRNGWLLAPITAEIISAYVFGADIAPDWAALSPARFETT
ncbi:NAD(P)/FAD-dependent oxidoreductase [Terricaulis sp.]|uniref:NAD(P)/FAD-dependent oxidoreductase n=1 Tax=Terricaulis sp. TaxID=2768686 RepID=UPI0037839054